jgi:nicotinate-nucleotide adenylyltransferase
MPKKTLTAIFPGSFNPIHIGHLALANWICEYGGVDELWFMVTPHNPLKEKDGLIDDERRLEWVKRAIGDYPKFRASDFEFSLPQPSYTVNTLKALKEAYPDREFALVMGADNWSVIKRWACWEEVLTYNIFVYPRRGFEIDIPKEYETVRRIDAPLIEISSTFVRESIEAGKDVRFFLPEAIREDFV